ncbi:phosphotransferase [Lichenifustis flavocetrariae]|uniref:Hydroxylysine kinase n=1 Tax=Lichenifustis flavocetrariae TaxID=2949735 RepID=A0AA41YUD9_9HYPH|nr:phosphotransferase [Lichenifustis flavocetrariae]MCW6508304.1 phosphotransferase [Lichenifustis flavocetrariae]
MYEPALGDAARLLATPPPAISAEDAVVVLRDHYGLKGRLQPLSGERDRNFRVEPDGHIPCVLKFYNDADDAETRDFQHGALLHMARAGVGCAVPRLIPTITGHPECTPEIAGRMQPAILLSLLPGVAPHTSDVTPALRHNLGRSAGTLGLALASFAHPRSRRVLLWDLMQVDRLLPIADDIEDASDRASLVALIERFVRDIRPQAESLPRHVIHNDLSGSNVLLSETDPTMVAGIIDFGDMVEAPRINDIAILASYFIGSSDPLAAICEVISGYDTVAPLSVAEVAAVYEAVLARVMTRILLNRWRAGLFPENRAYILRHAEAAGHLMKWFIHRDAEADRSALVQRCLGRRITP